MRFCSARARAVKFLKGIFGEVLDSKMSLILASFS